MVFNACYTLGPGETEMNKIYPTLEKLKSSGVTNMQTKITMQYNKCHNKGVYKVLSIEAQKR